MGPDGQGKGVYLPYKRLVPPSTVSASGRGALEAYAVRPFWLEISNDIILQSEDGNSFLKIDGRSNLVVCDWC